MAIKRPVLPLIIAWAGLAGCLREENSQPATRPNILVAISDDQSWVHTSITGCPFVRTPAFDRVAREGILFENAFVTSPGCAPSRASMVLGRYPWQNGHAGNHSSLWPRQLRPVGDLLQEAGYAVGRTGKGVGPFHWALSGRYEDPAGPELNGRRISAPYQFISGFDYAANFEEFLAQKDPEAPFFFWYGATEPHRPYEVGAGRASGKRLEDVVVPPFLPDSEEVRTDLLDYAIEIEWFDLHLGRILQVLEERGELDRTLILVTSDNGMPFPGAKANCYEYGVHVPLAIRWGGRIRPGGTVAEPVSLVDLTPTLLEAAGAPIPSEPPTAGRSLLGLLEGREKIEESAAVYFSRERHSSSRWSNLGYPQRAIRTEQYLYIRNFKPERWPSGAPLRYAEDRSLVPGYHDIDWGPETGLSMRYLMENRAETEMLPYVRHSLDKRPAEQLFDIRKDPSCLENLAEEPAFEAILEELRKRLEAYLRETSDPRLVGPDPDVFESYPRYARVREFPPPDWADSFDPQELEALIAKVDSDHSPMVPPKEIGKWGLEAGPWRLERQGDRWALFDLRADPETRRDLSAIKPQLTGQLEALYERYREP